jgi:hypothetical protein
VILGNKEILVCESTYGEKWEDEGIWPSEWKVVLDSPLSERILEEYTKFPECYDEETLREFFKGK